MKTVYVVVGFNGILNVAGTIGAASTPELAKKLMERQGWKLDQSQVMPVEIAENERDLEQWVD